MDAMASHSAQRALERLGQLWQMPVLVVSFGLFGYAAYRFIDPKPGPSLSQRVAGADSDLKSGRFEAAVDTANKLLASSKLSAEDEAHLHLLLAQTLEAVQNDRHLNVPANHERIISQTELALRVGIKPSSDLYRRLAESNEALGRLAPALQAFQKALELDASPSPALQRKVIELQLGQEQTAAADSTIERYLKTPKLDTADRAWAMVAKARGLIHHEKYPQACSLLADAMNFDPRPTPQGIAHYWLGYCLWKQGQSDDAERVLRVARDQLKVVHPLDADTADLLGKILLKEKKYAEAMAFFEAVMISHPGSPLAPLAKLGRGLCRIGMDANDAALTDLHDVATVIGANTDRVGLIPDAVEGLKQASKMLTAKSNYQGRWRRWNWNNPCCRKRRGIFRTAGQSL